SAELREFSSPIPRVRRTALQARTGDAALRFRFGTAQKETDLVPKLNRMPDRRLRCQGHYAEFTTANALPGSSPGWSAWWPGKSAGCAPYSKPGPAVRLRHKDGADKPANNAGTRGIRRRDRARRRPAHTGPA